jgi:hypothetical protein
MHTLPPYHGGVARKNVGRDVDVRLCVRGAQLGEHEAGAFRVQAAKDIIGADHHLEPSSLTSESKPFSTTIELSIVFAVRSAMSTSAEALGIQLAAALRTFRGDAEPLDDETIMVMARNDI